MYGATHPTHYDTMTQSIREITGEMASTAELNESERHQLLGSERRRTTLEVLSRRLTPIGLDELAAAVAERETDASSEQHTERIRISLHHKHLPKMADMGVIDYDEESHRVK